MDPDGPVVILSALTEEWAALADEIADPSGSHVAGRPVVAGSLDGVAVVLAAAGIGKVNTATTTALLVERFLPRVLVFTGVAGGIDPGLRIGDVVIADHTIQHDTGVLDDGGLQRYQPGHVPFFNPSDEFGYPTPEPLLERVKQRLDGFELPPLSQEAGGDGSSPRIVFGTVLSGDQFINSATHRVLLHEELGGVAVEMEGAALAQTATILGIAHLVIRSITDLAGESAPADFGRFLIEVSSNSVRVLRHLLPVL